MRRAKGARVASHPRPRIAPHTREVLGSLARILAMSGELPEALAEEFGQICRAVSVPKPPKQTPATSSIEHGHAISHWYSDPDFLEPSGLPRALPLSGDRSLTELVSRFLPGADPAAVLATLVKLGAVRQEGRRYRPVGRFVSQGRHREQAIFFLGTVLRGILRTIEHNLSCEPRHRLLDRTAINPRFPVRDLPAFHIRLRKDSTELLRYADSAMHSKERRGRREPTTRLGVTVIAFEDPLVTGHRTGAGRRSRRASRATRRGRRR